MVIVTDEAKADIREIAIYTEEEWGVKQRDKYLNDLDKTFHKIQQSPHLGRERKEIKNGVFSRSFQKHNIFYQLASDHLEILRVLHHARDVHRAFE